MNAALNEQPQDTPDFMSDKLDNDDIMKRIGQNLDDEKFLKMTCGFSACINKQGQAEAVVIHCTSVEADIFIDYLQPIEATKIEDPIAVMEAGKRYKGPEAFLLEDTYRLGLNEYLRVYGINEELSVALEHLSIVLDSQAKRDVSRMILEYFKNN